MTEGHSFTARHRLAAGCALLMLAMLIPPAAQAQSGPGAALAAIDRDRDGAISTAEAEAIGKARFAELDRDGDGAISAEEFAAPRRAAFAAADGNGDGKLSRGELRAGASAL